MTSSTFQSLIAIAISVLMGAQSPPSAAQETSRPNVLLISLDDLNDWIEPLGGHPQALTPQLSAFAQESVLFKHAYCASPSCNPSRTALMTGKAPYVTGVYTNPQIWRHILPNEITLPEYFKAAGYWTAGAGKLFHNNMPDPRSWNAYYPSLIQHFPQYYLPDIDSQSGKKIFRKQDNELREDEPLGITFNMPYFKGSYIAFDWAPLPYKIEETGDYESVKWVIDQLHRKHEKPFFLGCGIYRPHLPLYVPQEYYDKFPLEEIQLPLTLENDLDDIPAAGKQIAHAKNDHQHVIEADQWKQAVQGYLAAVNYADDLTGRLLKALADSPYVENTVVIVFSDHGWQLGEKEHWQKHALWENLIKSVLMIKVPDKLRQGSLAINHGSTCSHNVSLTDLFPTLTELCGLAPKPGVTGHSLVPLLENPARKGWNFPVISTLGSEHYSVRKDQWHYISYDNGSGEELYDLVNDPEEWHNLAANSQYENIIQKLKAAIPTDRKEFVQTKPLLWKDVLSGETKFYDEE